MCSKEKFQKIIKTRKGTEIKRKELIRKNRRKEKKEKIVFGV